MAACMTLLDDVGIDGKQNKMSMKSFKNLHNIPSSQMLVADDLVEFHAARILLLIRICGGQKSELEGLTKLAKLDFFIRYPEFFFRVIGKLEDSTSKQTESPMIRYLYGPWDKRYYHVLAYLESKQLISISKGSPKVFKFTLTNLGAFTADALRENISFAELKSHIEKVAAELGEKKGNYLKRLIYDVFEKEVGEKELGKVIEYER